MTTEAETTAGDRGKAHWPSTNSQSLERRAGSQLPPRPPTRRVTAEELRHLRNDVPVEGVINELGLEHRLRGKRREYRCPACDGFDVAVHVRQNLARCFRCGRNYNPIDLLMTARRASFLEAVHELRRISGAGAIPSPLRAKHPFANENGIW